MLKLNVMVVDDDSITGSAVLRMLRSMFEHVEVAHDPVTALRRFVMQTPDIVICDVSKPDLNPFTMIEKIRKIDAGIKIAVFTHCDDKQRLERISRMDIDRFFCTPVVKDHFFRSIKRLGKEILEKREVETALQRQKNVLLSLNNMAEHFLQHTDWDETLRRHLMALKFAAEATAVFIFQNERSDDPQVAREYITINDDPHARSPGIVSYRPLDIMQWKKSLADGQTVKGLVDDFRSSEQHLLYDYRINSLLLIPIFSENRWWGFMGVGNNAGRSFDDIDVRTLNTVARIIGSAVNNQRNMQSLEMTSAIFKYTVDGVVITDAENRIIHTNDAFTKITGFTAAEVLGKNPKILRSNAHDKKFYSDMWRQIKEYGYWQGEIRNRKKRGEVYLEWLSINTIRNNRGEVENYIAVFSDITSHRATDTDYAYLATHDALTGLSNRLILGDRLEHAITHARRFNKMVGVLFCDLDNFKPINDTFGHHIGDGVLKQCADFFKTTLRSDDTICRYGGDEFVIILEDIEEMWQLGSLLEKVMEITALPCNIDGHTINIQMSVGVSVYPHDGDDPELIERADQAMYRAKNAGKNGFALYNESLLHMSDAKIRETDFELTF